jgi:hypothetical protein
MSGVLLRCPNCGTAQPAGGECGACHEAQVRYFCTNHNPGLWLDSAACAQCGARFGDPEPARKAPPPPPLPAEYRPSRPREPGLDPRSMGSDPGPWSAGPPEEAGAGSDGPRRPDASRLLLAILHAAARSRRRRSERYDSERHDDGEYAPPRGGGCIRGLLVLVLLLIGLFLIVPIFLGALLGFG